PGKLRISARAVEPAAVAAASVDAVRPAAAAKSIALGVSVDPAVGTVLADPDRLQQILWNLLSNAIKFTPDKGRVDLTLRCAGTDVVIQVRDSGQGISAALLPHVFDRFRQADARRPITGLGLGLSIVRHLVEVHGGTIRAESPGEGQGATFTVNLPIPTFELDGAEGHEAPGALDGPSLEGLRVLVVDDEADARESLTAVLEQCGAVVTAVASAREALGALAHQRPDILVSDIGMPEEDGYALIEKVRVLDARHGGRIPA